MATTALQHPLDRLADLIRVEMDAAKLIDADAERLVTFLVVLDLIERVKREAEEAAAEYVPGRVYGPETGS